MSINSITIPYVPGDKVVYIDRHKRLQSGKVRSVDVRFPSVGREPYAIYSVSHPSYRNGVMYCGEDDIKSKA